MKVTSRFHSNVNFGRNLREEEIADYSKTLRQGKSLVGQTGNHILIVPDTCLPQSLHSNTGVGNISSKDAQEFFKYMKLYLGIDTIETLPQGEYYPYKNLYCAYTGTALSLGKYQINPELLATNEFENLLTREEVASLVQANNISDKETRVNFKNVFEDDGNFDTLLKKAYNRFNKLDANHPLKQEFSAYVSENNDWLEPKVLYSILGKEHKSYKYEQWPSELDKNLFNSDWDFNTRDTRIKELKNAHSEDFEFYNFKQFMADKHLAYGKQQLNDIGLQLKGDCLINFSTDERWANPKAFKTDYYVGDPKWKLFALDFETIADKSSPASKLLQRKVGLFARRYDSIRFDVGWSYVRPKLTNKDKTHSYNPYMGDTILNQIEETVKSVKGQDYNLNNLAYEFEADGKDFPIFKPGSADLIDPLKTRTKIYGSTYMHDYSFCDRWGAYNIFTDIFKWAPDNLVYGIGNHDPQPLRQIAKGIADKTQEGSPVHKYGAVEVLSRFFNVSQDFLQNPVEFAKAKWAETMQAKNLQMFYMDVFGREERFDMQCFNTTVHPEKNYAYKIPTDYKTAYQNALSEGFGFNPMDALEKLFKKNGLDKTQPELYAKIVKYRDILLEKEVAAAVVNGTSQTKSVKGLGSLAAVLLTGVAILGGGTYAYNKHKEKDSVKN